MNRTIISLIVTMVALLVGTYTPSTAQNAAATAATKALTAETGKVVELTAEQFKMLVYDYASQKEWKLKSNLPVIVDFYATWCGPCRVVKPRLQTIAKEYAGKIRVYAVDVDKETEAARAMKVEVLPTIFTMSTKGLPVKSVGALSLEQLRKLADQMISDSKK